MRFRYWFVQAITVVRIPLGAVFATLLLTAPTGPLTPTRLWIAASVLLVAELTDLVDGWLARRWKVVTEWGAMLDPYADSMARLVVYWGLACSGLTWAVVPLVMALRDVTVSYCRVIWSKQGSSVSAQWSGKVKAVVQGVAAFFLLLAPIAGPWWGDPQGVSTRTVASCCVIAITLFSGYDYARRAVSLIGTGAPR